MTDADRETSANLLALYGQEVAQTLARLQARLSPLEWRLTLIDAGLDDAQAARLIALAERIKRPKPNEGSV